jgi:hypothetical protein
MYKQQAIESQSIICQELKLKLNRRVGRQRQPNLFFNLTSAGLAPIVALANLANPAFLLPAARCGTC